MATTYLLQSYTSFFALLCCLFSPCFCLEMGRWGAGGATWYGGATGYGSDGGACGYGNAVGMAPFSSMVAAGSPSLYKAGKGCGVCYEVRCIKNHACSQEPVTVVITDECPGGPCLTESAHFDLSGTAIGAMARPGFANQLRGVGIVPIQYVRVTCKYPHKTVTFHVDSGSTPNYLSVLIEFEDGDGDLASLDLRESRPKLSSVPWRPMRQSWGAVWKLDSRWTLIAPFSIRLTTRYSKKSLIARNVIPSNWRAGATYRSLVNFS